MPVSPPRPRSLALNALRAFEAAARHRGFAAAADELGVSAGAVSAHVKALEAELGAPLFTRTPRGVDLTALGLKALPELTAAFDALSDATRTLRAEAAPHVVHIVALPSVAELWLSPRLPRLRAAAPELEISITALERPPNLKRTPFDLCLFLSRSQGENLEADEIFPVCAPQIATTLSVPEDLRDVPCVTDTTWTDDWRIWAAQAMPGQDFAPRGPEFSLYSLALAEAVNGAGVLMGHLPLVAPYLESGALVAPFRDRVSMPNGLRMWSPRAIRAGSPVARVANWLKSGL